MTNYKEQLLDFYEQDIYDRHYNGKFLHRQGKQMLVFHENRLNEMTDDEAYLELELVRKN